MGNGRAFRGCGPELRDQVAARTRLREVRYPVVHQAATDCHNPARDVDRPAAALDDPRSAHREGGEPAESRRVSSSGATATVTPLPCHRWRKYGPPRSIQGYRWSATGPSSTSMSRLTTPGSRNPSPTSPMSGIRSASRPVFHCRRRGHPAMRPRLSAGQDHNANDPTTGASRNPSQIRAEPAFRR